MNTPDQLPVPQAQNPQPQSLASAPLPLPPAVPLEKPRADSRLKTLPEERQFEIPEYSRSHSLAEAVQWLDANGIPTSSPALCRFLAWYRLREQRAQNDIVAEELLAQAAEHNPALTPERLQELGFMFFSGLALANQDPKTWFLAQRIALHKARVDLAAEKYHDQKKALEPSDAGGLTPETIEKIERELHLR